jgi:hypothetical protein
MREGSPEAGRSRLAPGGRHAGNAGHAGLVVLGVLLLALAAGEWPLANLAHQSVNAAGGSTPYWGFGPFAVVGLVVAWWRPRNPLGWILVGLAVVFGLSEDASFYAVADYRLRHGTLPLGWVAMFAQPGWAIGIILVGLAILLFPDGKLASARMWGVLWLYLALAVAWMVSAYVITADAVIRHDIRVDPSGNLLALDNVPSSPAWWNVLQTVVFATMALSWLATLAGQVASYRRSSGERRLQLKWLLGGFAAALAGVGVKLALASTHGSWAIVGDVALLAVYAIPLSMGVAIMRYRLYDIDRIVSRTLAYAIVTGLLVGVYAGMVLLATEVLRFHSSVAVATSTLVAAALFNPVRHRVQHMVDRRFNRARYDADRTIAQFAARLQDAVDLDTVHADLAEVIQAALEPAHLTVWTAPRE